MPFIDTKSSGSERVNISEIVRLKESNGETVAELRDGSKVKLPGGLDWAAHAACQFIPANPGFELITAHCGDSGEMYFERQPIIGWRLDWYGPDAVVLDCEGHHVTRGNQAIKYPDGQVLRTCSRTFDTKAD